MIDPIKRLARQAARRAYQSAWKSARRIDRLLARIDAAKRRNVLANRRQATTARDDRNMEAA